MKTCPRCGQQADDTVRFCGNCGYDFMAAPTTEAQHYNGSTTNTQSDNLFDACGPEGKSRGVAALLAIFIGCLGIHYFYLGKNTGGLICIILSVVTCGLWSTITFIQGILMLCMTNEQFRQKYILNPSSFPIF